MNVNFVRYSALKNDEDKIGWIIHNAKDIITEIEKYKMKNILIILSLRHP